MVKIALDAGHGLKTSGKQTPDGIKEWTLNDKVRDKVVAILKDYDVSIIHTDNDEGIVDETLEDRLNRYVDKDFDAFVSIHHNANTGTWNNATGVETYTDNKPTTADLRLADCIQARLAKYTGLRNRGVKHLDFYVINQDRIPAVLVEGGFMDSNIDYKVITSDEGQTAYAKAVAEGLIEFLKLKKKVVEHKPTETIQNGTRAKDLAAIKNVDIPAKVGPLFTEDQKKTGVLASVSLAQFLLESAYGKSELAQKANNCFGMKTSLSGNTWSGSVWNGDKYIKETSEFENGKYKTITADFRKYPCIEDSIEDHSAYLLGAMNGNKKRYEGLKGCTDPAKAIQIIKDGGYATSPTYVESVLNLIDKYNLTQYDCKAPIEPVTPEKSDKTIELPRVPFSVKVIVDDLNYRSEPSMGNNIKGQTGKGIFTITQVSEGWGKLKSGIGWIWLINPEYCTVIQAVEEVPFLVKVGIQRLNIRKGPGIDYSTTGSYTGIGTFTIVEVKEGKGSNTGWGKLKSGGGWISLDHTTRIIKG